MLSFHDDINVKRKYVARTEAHRTADEIIRGLGWDGSKGCAVGCTLENYDHSRYPIELGIPEWLARVEDTLFEGMSFDHAMLWPSEFLLAIPVGVTEDQFERNVKAPFLIHILESTLKNFDNAAFPDVTKAVQGSIALWRRSDIGSDSFRSAAWSAAYAARSAARSAAYAARSAAYAARSTADAARSTAYAAADAAAAWSAAYAAWSAAYAARSAAYAARSARSAAWSAAYAARSARSAAADAAAYDGYADILLNLLKTSNRT